MRRTLEKGRYILTGIILIRVIYTDIRERKIENWIIGIGMTIGILVTVCTNGQKAIVEMLQHIGWIWAGLYLLYLVNGLGAGDVKLLFMLSILYPEKALDIIVYSFVMAAAYILLRMTIRGMQKKPVYERGEQIAFSIPIVCSVVLCLGKEMMECFGLVF